MEKLVKTITESTALPISLVILIGGGIAWLSNLYFISDSNAKALDVVSKKQEIYSEQMSEIKSDIKVIKESILKMEKENGK